MHPRAKIISETSLPECVTFTPRSPNKCFRPKVVPAPPTFHLGELQTIRHVTKDAVLFFFLPPTLSPLADLCKGLITMVYA